MKTTKLSHAQIARRNAAIDRQIAKKNAAFNKATDAEKRVMVAKDALYRLSIGQAKPSLGTWTNFKEINTERDRIDPAWNPCGGGDADKFKAFAALPLQDKIVKDGISCTCCALGGLLTSCVAIKNELSVGDFIDLELSGEAAIDGDDAAGLHTFFDSTQLKLIEFVFEKGQGYVSDKNDIYLESSEAEETAARAFIKRYPKVKDRYKAIFLNIVRNKGTFIP